MNTSKVTTQLRLKSWVENFRDQQASSLSIKDWCEQNGFSQYQFFYWKRKLKEACLESVLPEIVPITLPAASGTQTSFTADLSPSQPTDTSCTTEAVIPTHPSQTLPTCTSCTTEAKAIPVPADQPARTSCATPSLTLRINDISIEINQHTPDILISKVIQAVRHA